MAIKWRERKNSREATTNPPSIVLRYCATGEHDQNTVHNAALAYTSGLWAMPAGLLYRQDVKVEAAGYDIYYVEVPYAAKKEDVGSFQLSFDTTGGTVHITASKQTIAAYGTGATVNDHKQAIGVTGPSNDPDGADVVIPVLKLTATFKHPQGIITLPQIKNLARWTGKVNSDTFLTFAPGEVLFLGCTGSEGTDSPTDIQYHFACSENLTGLSIGGITVANKLGHHLYWIQFQSGVTPDGKSGTRIPAKVFVERVYDTIAMATSLGFGS